jgi:hypothetical protein
MYIDLRPLQSIFVLDLIVKMVTVTKAKLTLNVISPVLQEFSDAEAGIT